MILIVQSTLSAHSSIRSRRLSASTIFSLIILCTIPFVNGIGEEEDVDEIDTAFSGILSQIDSLSRGGRGGIGDGFFGPSYGSNYGSHSLFGGSGIGDGNNPLARLLPRVASIANRVQRVVGDLHRIGLADEALALKFNLIRLASQLPGFENALMPKFLRGLGGGGNYGGFGNYGPNSFGSGPGFGSGSGYNPFGSSTVNQQNFEGVDDRRIERRLDDFDDMIKRYSKESADWQSLSPEEREKRLDNHQKTLTVLDEQRSKLIKKSFYTRNRIEFLINDMSGEPSNSPRNNKSLIERLTTWKKFIENNELVLKSQLTREERDTLYSFLSRKFKEIEPDIRQAEDHVFELV